MDSSSLPSTAREVLGRTSVDSWQISGRHLAAILEEWLRPGRIDTLIRDVIVVSAAIGRSAPAAIDQPSIERRGRG